MRLNNAPQIWQWKTPHMPGISPSLPLSHRYDGMFSVSGRLQPFDACAHWIRCSGERCTLAESGQAAFGGGGLTQRIRGAHCRLVSVFRTALCFWSQQRQRRRQRRQRQQHQRVSSFSSDVVTLLYCMYLLICLTSYEWVLSLFSNRN